MLDIQHSCYLLVPIVAILEAFFPVAFLPGYIISRGIFSGYQLHVGLFRNENRVILFVVALSLYSRSTLALQKATDRQTDNLMTIAELEMQLQPFAKNAIL